MSLKFTCLQCAHCCRQLIQNHPYLPGVKSGLFLLPQEVKLFPKEHIYPNRGWGLKGRARPRPKLIYAYQLDLKVCPHLRGNLCGIYENRPLGCQGYPFEGLEPIARYMVHPECRWFKLYLKNKTDIKIEALEEVKANKRIGAYLAMVLKAAEGPDWIYNLTTKKWVMLDEEKGKEWVSKTFNLLPPIM